MILSDIDYLEPISNSSNQIPDRVSGGKSFATVITDASSGGTISFAKAGSSGDITKSITTTSTNVNSSLIDTGTATGSAITFGITTDSNIDVTAAVDGGVSVFVGSP
ncbi:MAG: hypothetical protein ACFBSE_08635 [Prochloraceae cyanobacterium]